MLHCIYVHIQCVKRATDKYRQFSTGALLNDLTQLTTLLHILCLGSLPQFMQFCGSQSQRTALLDKYHLSVDKIHHMLKLYTICNLVESQQHQMGAGHKHENAPATEELSNANVGNNSNNSQGTVLSFSAIARHIHCDVDTTASAERQQQQIDDGVQYWVVEAIANQLIDATMDQYNHSVTVR